mmetsp:Transcript_19743/g.47120  ORF Transcript_19743/g.47120 Transcript_19743/m.47120 type:complete len:381 (+) Transcript_19743:205-1347(+)
MCTQIVHDLCDLVANDDAMDFKAKLVNRTPKPRCDVLAGWPDLSICDHHDVGLRPLLTAELLERPLKRGINIRPSLEAVLEESEQLLKGRRLKRKLKFVHLSRAAEGVEVALALLPVGPAHALERERLGDRLPRPAHGAACVEADDDGPLLGRGADLKVVGDPRWDILEPSGALVAEEVALGSAGEVQEAGGPAAGAVGEGPLVLVGARLREVRRGHRTHPRPSLRDKRRLRRQHQREVPRARKPRGLLRLKRGPDHPRRLPCRLDLPWGAAAGAAAAAAPELPHEVPQLLQVLELLAEPVELLPPAHLPHVSRQVEALRAVHQALEVVEGGVGGLKVLHGGGPLLLEVLHDLLGDGLRVCRRVFALLRLFLLLLSAAAL